MISKDGISYGNMKDGMARDDTPGKKTLYKNFIYNEFTFTYASSYIENIGQKCQVIQKLNIQWIYIYICIFIYWKHWTEMSSYTKT